MKRTWTPEEEKLLIKEYPTATSNQIRVLFPNKSNSQIKCKLRHLGLKKQVQRFRFTDNQIEELKKDYADTSNKELADRFGCSISAVENRAFRLKLRKDIEYTRRVSKENFTEDHPARKYWIKKGTPSRNKGKKQEEFMSKEAIERSKATRFQKGSIPPNSVSVGYERLSEDGYLYIKVEGKRKLLLKHRHVWEQQNGPIPKGYNIQFKDGNRQNCDIENLYIISRAEQMKEKNSGSKNLPDSIVALYLAGKRGSDKVLINQLKKHPELLELKRKQILLNRKIKEQNGSN